MENKEGTTTGVKIYEFGDLVLTCSCGHTATIGENIQGGVRYDLYATDKHNLTLQCANCNHSIKLSFVEAANPPIEDVESEAVTEEDTKVESEAPTTDNETIEAIDEDLQADAEYNEGTVTEELQLETEE
jgi:predicted  nucleic acid-binding Zn-ribbon protein